MNELKKNWLWIAALCAVGYYIYRQQQNTALKTAPAGGGVM